MGFLGSDLLDGLLLQLFLSNPGAATKSSSETFHLNHLFAPLVVVDAVYKGYDGIAGLGSLSDICGTVWFANVPATEGLESVDGAENQVDVLKALTHPSTTYNTEHRNIPKNTSGVEYSGYAGNLDFSSAAPILFGTSVLGSVPSSFPNVSVSDYWLNSGSSFRQATGDNKVVYKPNALMYPALDFSTIHDIANYTITATNLSTSDGSGLGVNVTNLSSLRLADVKPFAHPNDVLATTAGKTKSDFAGLLKLVSDISAISTKANGDTLVSNYAAYPSIFVSNGIGRSAQTNDVRDMSGSDIAVGPHFDTSGSSGAASGITDAAMVTATITDYLKPMSANLSKLNAQIEDVTWKDIVDATGFGLNVLAWKNVGGLTAQLKADITANTADAKAEYQVDYAYNDTTGIVSSEGHPTNYGLLDAAMKSAALEMMPYQDGSAGKIKAAGFANDISSGNVYLRLQKLHELGVSPETFLYWKKDPRGISQNNGIAYSTNLSGETYNFAGNMAGRDISAGLVDIATNAGGFYGSPAVVGLHHPGQIPWEYTDAMTAVYGNDFFGVLSVYDIVTRMSNDDATWAQAYNRLDLSLNGTGKSNQDATYVNANQLVYNSYETTCKASGIVDLYRSIYAFAGLDLDEDDDNSKYDGYKKFYNEISSVNVYPTGANTTTATAVGQIDAGNGGTTDNKQYSAWNSYNDFSGSESILGGSIPVGSVPMYTSDMVKKYRLQEQLVDTTTAQLYQFAQCDGVTMEMVKEMIDAAAGRFKQIPYSALVNSHAEASNILVAVDYVGSTALPGSLKEQFDIADMSMCLLKECYKAVFPEATELQLVNKILDDQYSSAAADVNAINDTIDQLLDCNVSMDTILSANVGNWNNNQQIGDTVGIYATGETTTIVRAQGIATAFASKPELSYAFFDDMSSGILDMSGLNPAPYSTAPVGGSLTTVTNQQKADMVDFMLFFGVDQEIIYNMMGANNYTRTYWVKNWLKLTRQAGEDNDGNNGGLVNNQPTNGLYGNSAATASPLAFVSQSKELIRKIPIGDLINDSDFGLNYAGWGSDRGDKAYWVLAYQPHELKAAGIPCDAVILSAITTGYVIDPNTLALEATNKCAFSNAQLKANNGYTQAEIEEAVGKI